jgi:glycosyltransferase involved in cell wall biosynthesis
MRGQWSDMSSPTSNRVPEGRLKILLVGHAFWPGEGSEPGLTWNWAWHLAQHHDTWVLAHPLHRETVEAAFLGHSGPAPHVVWVDVPREPEQGERGIRVHYLRWQRAALAQARRLHVAKNFDIAHHVSWGTILAPPGLWRLGVPFVWGPIGGGQTAPLRFGRYLGWRGTLGEAGRNVRRRLLPLLPPLRRTAANSAVVLATNRETMEILYRVGARRVELFLDNGVGSDQFIARQRIQRPGDQFELLWAGRLEARKALPLALEAMARVRDLPVRLRIAGEGPLRAAYERQASRMGLTESVRFLGFVPRERLLSDLFASSDAFFFTSLQDSFGSVVIEAMATGLPVLTLDHQGVGAMIPEQAAIKVAVTSPASTVQSLAEAIRILARSPDLVRRMGDAARHYAVTESWNRRVIRMNALYKSCLNPRTDRARVSIDESGRALAGSSA